MPYCTHYTVGVSVGTMAQPTAIGVIEQESYQENDGGRDVKELRLRHLERMPLDSSYPDLAKRLRKIQDGLKEKEQGSETDLIVDMTGTGKTIIEFLTDQELRPIRTVITSGHGEQEQENGVWRISKVELVGALQVLFQTDKFKVASGLALAPALKEELTNFRMKAQPLNGSDIESWREGQFDDLVFAVALATWQAQRNIPIAASVMDDFQRRFDEANGNFSWVV